MNDEIVARVDGEIIEKFGVTGEGGLELLELPAEFREFVYDNREALEADPRLFCAKLDIDPSEIGRADDILERINARVESAEIRDGNVLVLAYVESNFSDWIVDVWNCHGVLKPRKWGLGHGYKPDLSERGLRWIFIRGVCVPARRELTGREKRKILELLGEFVLLTRSGFYPVDNETLEKLKGFGVTAER